MLFSLVLFLSGGAALVSAANVGHVNDVGAVKRAFDTINAGGCEVDTLNGLIQGNLQAAIPVCVQYGAKVVTETVTSTSMRTKVITKTTTVLAGRKLKARAAEITPAPEVLERRGEAANALVHQLEKCPESAVSVACKGDGNQRVITTTTTALKRTTVTSTKTVTVTDSPQSPPFRIYSEGGGGGDGRKRSPNEPLPKMYWQQWFAAPQLIDLTDDVEKATVFFIDTVTHGFVNSLAYYSNHPTYATGDILYSVYTKAASINVWLFTLEYLETMVGTYGPVKWEVD